MTAIDTPPDLCSLQPVTACLEAVGVALAELPSGPIESDAPEALREAIVATARIERQLGELRLRLARTAETSEVAQEDASSGADAWLAKLTGSSAAVMRGGLWLARMLQERYPAVREAFAAGGLGEEHARIIVRAAERAPSFVPAEEVQEAVRALVAQTVEQQLSPKRLRRRVRRMLDLVSRAAADQHEAALIGEEEDQAAAETWMTLHDNGNGTWTGRFVIPDLHGQMLATHLEHLRSPRRLSRNRANDPIVDPTVDDATGNFSGLSWSESLGQGLVELIEHLPTDGLACGAGIIPAVYGGASLALDVGHESRLHSKAQRVALSWVHDTCAAEGCERPFAWCEIHHPHAWAEGGRTDLDNGVPLCGWHHRRAHDERYQLQWLVSGEIRFKRRRRERQAA